MFNNSGSLLHTSLTQAKPVIQVVSMLRIGLNEQFAELNIVGVPWPTYASSTSGVSLKLQASNVTAIPDNYRSDGVNYIRTNVLT